MTIDQLNRKIVINNYTFSQDSNGGNIKTIDDSYVVWAKVEFKTASRRLDNSAITYNKAAEITKRHEISRPLSNTSEIVYDGETFVIHSIKQIEEGKRSWEQILCYTN